MSRRPISLDRIERLPEVVAGQVASDEFKFLVLMHTNRQDLGARYRELLLPIPRSPEKREQWARPISE